MKFADKHRAMVSEAIARQRAGNVTEARRIYHLVLEENPDHADALHLLGLLADDEGDTAAAADYIRRAVNNCPHAYPYHYNLANVLSKLKLSQEALGHYRTAIQLKPDYAQAHNNLGLLLFDQGDVSSAIQHYRTAIRLAPNYPDPHCHLGTVLLSQGLVQGAITHFERALRIKPDYTGAYFGLGNAYLQLQQPGRALAAYHHAADIDPNISALQTNMGAALIKLGRVADAEGAFRRALKLKPSDIQSRSNLILALSYTSNDPAALLSQCLQWESSDADPSNQTMRDHKSRSHSASKLRIGYVSADFRTHAAAYWFEPLLMGHKKTDCEVYCYSNSEIEDQTTVRLKQLATGWRDCWRLTDAELVACIQKDSIDVLVDLSGHTDGNRLTAFAAGAAPVQVSWFGFPTSTGLRAMHYRLTDDVIDPPEDENKYFSESLIRLTRFYAAFRPDPLTPPPGETPALRNGHVTLASFNNLAKVTPEVMRAWCAILRAVPTARFLMQTAGLEAQDIEKEVRRFFTDQGIEAHRLTTKGWCDLPEFLSSGQTVDVVLDCFPFNGGVTTSHCLWMGIPIVSWAGKTSASRVGRSMLARMDLLSLVAESYEEYVEKSIELARDPKRIQLLRNEMRYRMEQADLLDGEGLARTVTDVFRGLRARPLN